jgi:hypothetical protein
MVSLSHGLRIGAFVLLLGLATSAGAGAEVVLIRPLTINVPGQLTISVATPPPRTVSFSSIAIAVSTPAPAIVHVQPLSISVRDRLPVSRNPSSSRLRKVFDMRKNASLLFGTALVALCAFIPTVAAAREYDFVLSSVSVSLPPAVLAKVQPIGMTCEIFGGPIQLAQTTVPRWRTAPTWFKRYRGG